MRNDRRMFSVLVLITLGLVLCPRAPVAADILPRGSKGVAVAVRIVRGGLADQVFSWHAVQKDETLTGIAQALLGRADRWTEIRDLNPGIEPEKLQPGRRLLVPPRAEKKEGEERWHLFVLPSILGGDPQRVDFDEDLRNVNRGFEVVLVPDARLQAFQAALQTEGEKKRRGEETWRAVEGVRISQRTLINRYAPDRSTVASRSYECRLDKVGERNLDLTVTTRDVDSAGTQVSQSSIFGAGNAPLLVMAFFALTALGWLSARRRARCSKQSA